MFNSNFSAQMKNVQIKRLPLDKGGQLTIDLTLLARLTDSMKESLGDDIDSLWGTSLNLKNMTIEEPAEGLILEIYSGIPSEESKPAMALSNLATSKYKLSKDDDTHEVYITVVLKSKAVSVDDIANIFNFLGRESVFSLDYAQGDLGV